MSRIYWDTMIFVYLLEDHPLFGEEAARIVSRMRQRSDVLCTSVFTLGELLLRPVRDNERALAECIRKTIGPPTVDLIPVSRPAMEKYAEIRADKSVSAADAMHLACAADFGTDLFITHDRRLHRLTVPGIQFIAGLNSGLI